jgi:hypothetical protein
MAATEGRVEARVTNVSHQEGSEFRDIVLDHPSIKRLSTKFQEGINQAIEAKQSGVPWRITYREVPSTNINPQTNRPYAPRRYWLSGEPVDGVTPAAPDVDEETPAFNRRTHPIDAWRICLSAGAKLAVSTLPMMPVHQRDFNTQTAIASAWAEFFYFTPPPQGPSFNSGNSFPTSSPARATGSAGAYDEPLGPSATADDPSAHDDSDIPY